MPPRSTIWLYAISAVSVLALSVGTCLVHRIRRKTRLSDYAFGAATWFVSVAMKVVLALIVFSSLKRMLGPRLPMLVTMLATGLLTGITEPVLTFLVGKRKRWRTASWDSMVGFGLAFGCVEAAVLAVALLCAVLLTHLPQLLDPDDARGILERFSDQGGVLRFVFERAIAVPVHLLSSVLAMRATRTNRIALFWWSFALKSLIDAVPSDGEISQSAQELLYGLFGIVSAVGFLWYSRVVRNEASR